MPSTEDFIDALRAKLREAETRGQRFVDVNAGQLHRSIGGYPGPSHRMPACCGAMYAEQGAADTIIDAPLRGKGASLTIRYILPR